MSLRRAVASTVGLVAAMVLVPFAALWVLWWVNPAMAVQLLNGTAYFLERYTWALTLWRGCLYAAIFVFWPLIGRWVRRREGRSWTEQDSADWNGYRYRLMVILVSMDVLFIHDQGLLVRMFQ